MRFDCYLMKNFLSKYYDKATLALSLLCFVIQFFVGQEKKNPVTAVTRSSQFEISNTGDSLLISPRKETDLLPGHFLYHRSGESTTWEKAEVVGIKIPRRSNVEITQTNGQIIAGTSISEFVIPKYWKSSSESISLRKNRDTIFIPTKKISSIKCMQGLILSPEDAILDWDDKELSFYQRSGDIPIAPGLSKVRWLAPKWEQNSTGYDLFTPPIIYIHQGKLTSRLPEKEAPSEMQEDFGLIFHHTTKSVYPLRLVSWAGKIPYFEDLTYTDKAMGGYSRNRLEVGKIYKKNNSIKPGQPSYIECDENDEDKLVTIEHFVVQQHKNSKTGGLRLVGRALVKDFTIGEEPFEINSLMSEVYAGELKFEFEFSLPKLANQQFNFTSKDVGKEFTFYGRQYRVSMINKESSELIITKQDPRVLEDVSKTFKF